MIDSRLEAEIERLESRFAANPEGRAFAPLADCYRKAERLEEALTLCLEGLERHPEYSSAHVIHAKILEDLERTVSAMVSWKKVLQLDTHNLLALRRIGIDLERNHERDEAASYWERILAVDPSNSEAKDYLGIEENAASTTSEFAGSPEVATPTEEASDETDATDGATPSVGQFESAAIDYDDPSAIELPDELGDGIESEDEAELEAELPSISASDPDGGELATLTLAKIYEEQGHNEKALRIYEAALKRNPDRTELIERIEALRSRPEPVLATPQAASLEDLESPPTKAARPPRPSPRPVTNAAPSPSVKGSEGGMSAPVASPRATRTAPVDEPAEDYDHFKQWVGRLKVQDS